MASDIGINFRATSTYVTDNADETYSLGETYPTVRGGYTFGWDQDMSGGSFTRDRDNTFDRRIAGVIFSSSSRAFRLDIEAGEYDVTLGFGDAFGRTDDVRIELQDLFTQLYLYGITSVSNDAYYDGTATGFASGYTAVNWPLNVASVRYTFSSTRLRIVLGSDLAQTSPLRHVAIRPVPAPSTLLWLPQQHVASGSRDAVVPSGMSN